MIVLNNLYEVGESLPVQSEQRHLSVAKVLLCYGNLIYHYYSIGFKNLALQ